MEKNVFTNLFAPFDRAGPAPRYQALRQAARARFQALPWPTARSEDWRFTSISPISETQWELSKEATEIHDDADRFIRRDFEPPLSTALHLAAMPSHQTMWLWFLNGRLASAAHMPGLGDPCFGSLAYSKSDLAGLGQIASDKDNLFAALNTCFLSDGGYLVIPDGLVVERPIVIYYLSQAGAKPTISNPRTLIVVGKNAQATIVERYIGEGSYFTNAVTEVAVGEGAVVDHVKLQQESTSAYHIANTQIVMARRSNFTTHYLALGGALVRNETRVRFDGEHAEATVNGLYLGAGKQHIDNFTVIDHAQPNCASHELYKGILNDRAHGVFNGKIFVRKDAQKTDAKQTNKVLLLSDDATINTKPQLEIFADDVKCTHGATIGQLDANQLFYLQSRGIPLEQARRLLTFAFANDIVGRIKIEAIRAELEARIVK